ACNVWYYWHQFGRSGNRLWRALFCADFFSYENRGSEVSAENHVRFVPVFACSADRVFIGSSSEEVEYGCRNKNRRRSKGAAGDESQKIRALAVHGNSRHAVRRMDKCLSCKTCRHRLGGNHFTLALLAEYGPHCTEQCHYGGGNSGGAPQQGGTR